MERPDLTLLNRPKAELRRIGALVGIIATPFAVAGAAVSAGGASASAEQAPPIFIPNDPSLRDEQTMRGLRYENLFEALARPRPAPIDGCWLIDTGLNPSNDIPESSIGIRFNSGTNTSDVSDKDGHGTGVADVWMAIDNNDFGTVGTAPGLCKLNVIKATGSLADEINYAGNHGARIINLSVSAGPKSSASDEQWQPVFDAMKKSNALFNLSVGNQGKPVNTGDVNSVNWLAANAPGNVMVVGGVNTDGSNAGSNEGGSNTGTRVDVKAMYCLATVGSDGKLHVNSNGYIIPSCGTSIAAPQVSGAETWVFACNPGISSATVKEVVIKSEQANQVLDINGAAGNSGKVPGVKACPEAPKPPTISTTTTTPEKKYTLITKVTAGANLGRLTINGKKMISPIYQTTVKGQVETIRPVKKTPKAYVKSVTGCENTQMKKTISPLLACYVKLDGIHAGKPVAVENVRYAFASH